MHLDITNKFKIIKSTKGKFDLIFTEVVFKECQDSGEVLYLLKLLQHEYESNPSFELLHGMKDRLSICFRNIFNEEDICFYASDE